MTTSTHQAGKRRWGRGAYKHDRTYYTFEEFVAFFEHMGIRTPTDIEGGGSSYDAALGFWQHCIDEEEELSALKRKLSALPLASLEDLRCARWCCLELQHMGSPELRGHPGCALRVFNTGAEYLGGGGWRSEVYIRPLSREPSCTSFALQAHTGGCLRVVGPDVDFNGSFDEFQMEETSVFKLQPCVGGAFAIIAQCNPGRLLGTFLIRKLPGASADEDTLEESFTASLEMAQAAVEANTELQGRRCHKQDRTKSYYSFEDFLIWVQKTFQLEADDAMTFAISIWRHGCVQPEDNCSAEGADGDWMLF